MAEQIEQSVPTTVDGVRAVEMRYRAIRETGTGDVAFYQTSMRLNSPSMGTLMPDRFLPVLECTDKCIKVFELAMIQVIRAEAKFSDRGVDFKWISVYLPLRLLRKPECANIVLKISDKHKATPEKLCFEIPSAVLKEKGTVCAESVSKLRRLGFNIMFSGVGAEGFPLMKLADFDFNYAMLDGSAVRTLGGGKRVQICTRSLISLVNDLEAEPIAADVTAQSQAKMLYENECSFYTGAYAGNFMLERFVRRKSSE